jgi:hypothetical protein
MSGVRRPRTSHYRYPLHRWPNCRQLHQMRLGDGMRMGPCEGVNRAAIRWSWAPALPVTIAIGSTLSPLIQGADLRVPWRLA